MTIPFQRGDQIVYLPPHTQRPLQLSDQIIQWPSEAEFGFVTGVREPYAYCRFWKDITAEHLRTKANSEAVPLDRLRRHVTTSQQWIDTWLEAEIPF